MSRIGFSRIARFPRSKIRARSRAARCPSTEIMGEALTAGAPSPLGCGGGTFWFWTRTSSNWKTGNTGYVTLPGPGSRYPQSRIGLWWLR